jgi:hypothetical protein
MSDVLIWTLEKARQQTLNLVEDLREDQICLQSFKGENHPAWILGHLLLADIYLLSLLKVQDLSADFSDLLSKYGPQSSPISAPQYYPSKQVMGERLRQTGLLRLEAVGQMKQEDLTGRTPDKMLVQAQPTLEYHLLALAIHEGHHGGQLSQWRKSQGLSSIKWAFAP